MLDLIFGLPVHPLIIHATVVAVPAAAISVILAAVWKGFRTWAGPIPLIISVIALILDPLTTRSGSDLEARLGSSPLIEKHEHLADGLLPWLIGVTVVAVIVTYVWYRERYQPDGPALALPLVGVVAVLALVAGVGTTQQVVRIGHSGAKAAWGGVKNENPGQSLGK